MAPDRGRDESCEVYIAAGNELRAPGGIRAALEHTGHRWTDPEPELRSALRAIATEHETDGGQREAAVPWHESCEAERPMLPARLTYLEAARELGYSSKKIVQRLVRSGDLVVVGNGSGRRVTRTSLLEYLDRQEAEARAKARARRAKK